MTLNRYISISLWVCLAALAAISRVAETWPINQWSALFLEDRLSLASMHASLPVPPENHPHAGIWLAREALENGNHQQAKFLVQHLAEAGNSYAMFVLGNILASSGDFNNAVKAWQNAGVYYVLQQAAWKARDELRIQDALLAGRAAWEINPEQGVASLSAFLKYTGDLDTSKELLLQALANYPNSKYRVQWLINLGDIERINASWEEAEKTYQQILSTHPDNIAARIGLGRVYLERGDGIEQAIGEFELAIKQSPDYGEGYFAIGQALEKEKRYDEAEIWYTKAIQRDLDNKQWWLTKANAARSAGSTDLALNIYQEMELLFPGWAPIYYEMAWAYKLNNQNDEAAQAIESALALLQTPNGWYFYRAGQIYEELGLVTKAHDAYAQALVLIPENQTFKNAVERLQNEVN